MTPTPTTARTGECLFAAVLTLSICGGAVLSVLVLCRCHPSPYQLAVYDMLRGLRAVEPQIAEHMLRLKSVPAPSPNRNSVRPAL